MARFSEDTSSRTCGIIVTQQEDGRYAYTMTSVGIDLSEEEILSLIEECHGPSQNLLFEMSILLDCTGVAVFGSPVPLSAEEEALCA